MQTLPRTPAQWVNLVRSGPDATQTPPLVTAIYWLWLVAFTLKMFGSTWDVSWHFKWLRDTAAPPHLLNTAGTILVVALVLFQARYNVGVDRLAKRLMVGGTAAFLVAIPIDVLNHEINGLDITAWSPSHALLYIGTAFMILGAIRGWTVSTPPGRARTLINALLWGFFLENVLFPAQHQEYGVLSLADWVAGRPTAEPILLEFAAEQIGRSVDYIAVESFALPVDAWVYPAWIVGAALLTLVAARHFTRWAWTATALAAGYLAYRAITWSLLVSTNFPKSVPPLLLLSGAVVIDLVFLAFAGRGAKILIPHERLATPTLAQPKSSATPVMMAALGAVLVTGVTASAGWLQKFVLEAPPMDTVGWFIGGVALLLGWAIIAMLNPEPANQR